MQRVLFKWRPSLNTGNIQSHLLLPTRHASAAALLFIYGKKKATLKLVPVFTGSGRHYLRSSDVALCWYLLLCMCNELQYVQEPEPNSVLNNTEQLFNSVNCNTPLLCSVREQLTSYSSPSTSYSSLFSFFLSSPASPPQDLYLLMRC